MFRETSYGDVLFFGPGEAGYDLLAQMAAASEARAYRWAVGNQGYVGSLSDWMSLSADERAEFERGAAGIPTQSRAGK